MRIGTAVWVAVVAFAAVARAVVFDISFDEAARREPATGRVVVYLLAEGKRGTTEPAAVHLFSEPQPMYGVDVRGMKAADGVRVDDAATSFPVKPSALPAGRYRVQAVLDVKRESGFWKREAGNLFSDVVEFEVDAAGRAGVPAVRPATTQPSPTAPAEIGSDGVVTVRLTNVVKEREVPKRDGVEIVDVKSDLLSKFRGRDVHVRAGVVWPVDYKPGRKYAAVYQVPSFGGDHLGAFSKAEAVAKLAVGSAERELYRNVFWIVPDPDGPNGHTLFTDSEVNGPCGQALIDELIPAIEARFPVVPERDARLVRGHSSGGWSALWLQVRYPDVFGACWSLSPDPVDFHRLERVDIYQQPNAYVDRESSPGHAVETPSFRVRSGPIQTVRQENAMEEVVGPDNTSAGQWDSWQAAWGHRNARGNPVPLLDPTTGAIDRTEAAFYRSHDITEMLRREPDRVGQILQRRVRLLSGDLDEFYLNGGAEFLKVTLDALQVPTADVDRWGYAKILRGVGHGSINQAAEAKGFEREALEYLKGRGFVASEK
jgi:pimeloyl-ACP methyl ester carboxylesterase